jgi:hypothetical protein
MLRTEDVLLELNEAIARFGTYTYYDKGAEEVLDVPALSVGVSELDTAAAGALLTTLFEHQHGHLLAQSLLASQEDRPDFTALLAACPAELQEYMDVAPVGLVLPVTSAADFLQSLRKR